MFEFRFAALQEYYLYLLLIPLLIFFFYYAGKLRQKALLKFGKMELLSKMMRSVSLKRRRWKAVLALLAVTLMIVALLRPQYSTKFEEISREGIDLVIAIDTSKSMLAEDIKPNRIEKAKSEVKGIIDRLQGDRIGLVAFAGDSFTICPLTMDYGAAKLFLDAIDTDIIPQPGTAIGDAIREATKAFNQQERKHKVVILITDGEDHDTEPVEAAEAAAEEGVVIYTVGIGSAEGVPIPMFDENGVRTGFMKDESGQTVISRLDELTLEKIAFNTDGAHYRATPGEAELDKIYEEISQMEKKEVGTMKFTNFEERFQWFLFPALIALLLESLLSDRARVKREWKGRFE